MVVLEFRPKTKLRVHFPRFLSGDGPIFCFLSGGILDNSLLFYIDLVQKVRSML